MSEFDLTVVTGSFEKAASQFRAITRAIHADLSFKALLAFANSPELAKYERARERALKRSRRNTEARKRARPRRGGR